MRRLPLMIVGAIAAAVLVAALLINDNLPAGEAGSGPPAAARGAMVTPVTVAVVAERPFVDRVRAIATARAFESVDISATVTERITAITFTDRQEVEAGQVLVRLQDDEERAELAALRSQLNEAQKQFERFSELAERGNASAARLDEIVGERDALRARARALEAKLEDHAIAAPFAGQVGLRLVSPGDLVRPGTVITTLDDLSRIKLDFPVPELFLGRLSNGLKVSAISAAFPGTPFEGVVAAIDSRVNPVSRAVTVRAVLDNREGQLKPGMMMTVELMFNERVVPAVPQMALNPVGERQYVFVVGPDDTVRRTEIVTGARTDGWVEVIEGLEPGARIVDQGVNRISDGRKVQVIDRPAAEI